MAKQLLNVRVEDELVGRASALIEHVKNDGGLERLKAAGTISRSAVIRLCLIEGIRRYEKKYRVHGEKGRRDNNGKGRA